MVERFLSQTSFSSQEDFNKNLKINVPENFNFGYDVVDAWAAEQPDKKALLWTNDKGESRQFSFAEMKRYTDMLSLIHISEPTRRTPISYAVFCLKKKKKTGTLLKDSI